MPAAPQLPTGTITFLFTDVEGSTKLWERHPEQMRVALARHDESIESLVAAHEGVVVRPRGEGDSRFAVFPRASEAVAAAAAIQHALHQERWPAETPLRVRMALHTGEADLRAGDYYGSAVNRAARLRAIAHGGQTVLSLPTEALVAETLPPGVSLQDLGEQRLSDLACPERVFALLVARTPSDLPPLRSLDALPNNLPLQLTSFVGRERASTAVNAQLARSRLVTLTGAGGSGKTRLALQVAADLVEAFAGGIWFVDLAPLSEEATVPQAVLAALGVPEAPARPAMETLTEFLRRRTTLLVLDNCEHLVEACARLVDVLLHACPRLTILATSREMLGVAGEAAWRVPSLSVPDTLPDTPSHTAHVTPPTRVEQYEAVRLFVDRASLVQPSFQVTPENAPALIEVCRRLDGMPLAIELAAARARVLSVEQIAIRLNDRFRLLTGGSRTALRRHQTLRALVDWSDDLLGGPERALLRRLAVFAGGWTLEAAEAVCTDADAGPFASTQGRLPTKGESSPAAIGASSFVVRRDEVLDLLTELVDKSLVVAEEQDGETRYRLLETVRQYAEEKLLESGEAAAVRDRHAEYYTALAEQAQPRVLGRDALWFRRLRREHDNLRTALQWAEATGNAALGLRAAGALHQFWHIRYRAEGRAWLNRLLALPGAEVPPAVRSRALSAVSTVAALQLDRAAAQASAEEALRLAQQAGGSSETALACFALAYSVWQSGAHAEAARLFEQSERLAREAGDRRWEVQAMGYRARALYNVAGEHAAAMRLVEQTLALSRESSDVFTTGWMLLWLGVDALTEGNRGHARALCRDALAIFRRWQDGVGTGTTTVGAALLTLAGQDYLDGDFAAGRARCRESLLIYHNVGETSSNVLAFEGLGVAAAGEGHWERALRLAGFARAMKAAFGAALEQSDPRTLFLEQLERAVSTARRELGEPAATAAWRAGEAMTYEQAIAYALAEDATESAARESAGAYGVPVCTPSPAPAPAAPAAPAAPGVLSVDALTHEVRVGAEPLRVRLSALEFQLLSYLYEQRPRVCTRRELGDAVWGAHAWDVNLLHGLVRRLKEKLEPDPAHPRYVITVPQVGYRLSATPAAEAAAATT